MPEKVFVTQAAYDALKIMQQQMHERGVRHASFPRVPRMNPLLMELVHRKNVLKKKTFVENNQHQFGFSIPFKDVAVNDKIHWKEQARIEREALEVQEHEREATVIEMHTTTSPSIKDAHALHPSKKEEFQPKPLPAIRQKREIITTGNAANERPPWLMPPESPMRVQLPNYHLVSEFVQAVDGAMIIMLDKRGSDLNNRVKELKLALADSYGVAENAIFQELIEARNEREALTMSVLFEVIADVSSESRFRGYTWGSIISLNPSDYTIS